MKLDGVTAADFHKDKCIILTYSGIEVFEFGENKFLKFTNLYRNSFLKLTQKEALCVHKNYIYLADEKVKSVFDAKLYKLKIK
jgi:hypothetical protein